MGRNNWTEEEYAAYQARNGQPRVTMPPAPEAALLTSVVVLAKRCGWLVYHTYDSRRSEAGFPDLVLVKPGHPVIFAELKRQDIKLPSGQQQAWLRSLGGATGVEAHLWRPDDWPTIEAILTQRGEP